MALQGKLEDDVESKQGVTRINYAGMMQCLKRVSH